MDSFEKLIPIIFLIVWTIIAVAAKKKKKQQQSRPDTLKKPKPQNMLFGKLQSTLDTFFSEMQPHNEVLEQADTFDNTIDEIDTEVTIPEIKIEPSKPVEKRKSPSDPYTHTLSAQSTDATARLREAVVWSEILGKPVSMRD